MQRLEVSCAVRLIYTSLGAKGLTTLLNMGLAAVVRDNKKSVCYDNLVNFGVPRPRTYYFHLLNTHLPKKIAIRFQDAAHYTSRVQESRPQPILKRLTLQNSAQRGLIYLTRNSYIALSHCVSRV